MEDTQEKDLTTITTPALVDKLRVVDDPAGTPVSANITIENFLKIINSLAEDTSPSGSADYLLEYDASATAAKKVRLDTLLALVNGLTEDTNPDESGDFLLSFDTSAGVAKKVKPSNISISGNVSAVYKSANEIVNNSSTLQNDDHLLFTGSANKSYLVRVGLIVTTVAGAGADDMKIGWSVPASTTGYYGSSADTWAAATGISPALGTGAAMVANQGISTAMVIGTSGSITGGYFVIEALIKVAGTAGTINFQWAQNSAGARDLTVEASSWLTYQQLN